MALKKKHVEKALRKLLRVQDDRKMKIKKACTRKACNMSVFNEPISAEQYPFRSDFPGSQQAVEDAAAEAAGTLTEGGVDGTGQSAAGTLQVGSRFLHICH